VDLTVTLTDDQLEAIAHRVAELLADRQATEPASGLLTPAQAAEVAGVSAKADRNWLSARRLVRHGVRGHPMVSRAELAALLGLASSRTAPEGAPQISARRRRNADGYFTTLAKKARL
jgi:hypothetical protein